LLTSAPHTTLWPATLRVLAKYPMSVIMGVATFNLYHIIATPEQAQFAFFSKDMPLDTVKKYHSRMNNESFRAYLDMLGLNLLHPQRVKMPLLAIGAANDAVISINDVKATAKAYGTEAVILPDIAHDVMLEAKWQVAADKILNWLKEKKL
jgi:alpha-beta hydrolase superfamily lysophospholipase